MAVPSLLVASKYLVRNCRTERSLNLVAGEVARGLTHWINLSCNLQAKIVAALEQAVIALFESVSQLHQQTSEGMCEFVAQVAPLLRAHAVQEIAPKPVRTFSGPNLRRFVHPLRPCRVGWKRVRPRVRLGE